MSDPNQRLGLQALGKQGPVSAGEQYQQDLRMGVRRPGLSRQSPRETTAEADMRKSRFGRIGQAGQQSGGGVFDQSASGDFTGGNITNDPKRPITVTQAGSYHRGGNIMSGFPHRDRLR
jgi:hypothetical protein